MSAVEEIEGSGNKDHLLYRGIPIAGDAKVVKFTGSTSEKKEGVRLSSKPST